MAKQKNEEVQKAVKDSQNLSDVTRGRISNLTVEERIKMLSDARDNALEWFCYQVEIRKASGSQASFSCYQSALDALERLENSSNTVSENPDGIPGFDPTKIVLHHNVAVSMEA